MGDEYTKQTTDTPTKKINYYVDVLRHKVALRKNVTPPPYTQVLVKGMTKISGLIDTEAKHAPWTGCRVRPGNGIHEVVANKQLEILFTNLFVVEKKFEGVIISYEKKSSVIYLAVTNTMVTRICDSLNLMVGQVTAARISQPCITVTDLTFTAPN